MLTNKLINRIIILAFMVLVGFSFAKAIYSQSILGIILSVVSLGAGIYFVYLLGKAREELQAARKEI